MRAPTDNPQPTKPQAKLATWPAILFAVAAIVWTATMMASLKWQFLDRFVVGSWHGRMGADFFQIPRGYNNLLIGNNIFLTDVGIYGPYATSYLNHPFLAVAIGPWTAPLAPWTAFWVFVVVSLGLLLIGARLLASAFPTPAYRGFAYFALLGSFPTYLMLWNAQVHVLVVLAMALILAGLMRLAEEPRLEKRYGRWIQARAADFAVVEAGGDPDAARAVPVAGNAAQAPPAPGRLCGGVAAILGRPGPQSRRL